MRRWRRATQLAVGASLLAVAAAACGSSPPSPNTTGTTTGRNLPVTVTSVEASPLSANSGGSSKTLQAELVRFEVGGHPGGGFACVVSVLNDGKTVGTAHVDAAAPSGTSTPESVTVTITGTAFQGTPADAHVTCGAT